MILGDSLLVMTSLAEKEGLKGQVQTIYIDPPYGIKFGSNWQVSTRKRDVRDGKDTDLTRQPEQVRAYRDTWELGINSYLAYLRDRLVATREMLTESGSVFVQIDAENVHLVRNLLDEVFGADNFCSLITYQKTAGMSSPMARVNVLASVADFVLWYARDKQCIKYRQLYLRKRSADDPEITLAPHQAARPARRDATRLFWVTLTSMGYADSGSFPVSFRGRFYKPGPSRHWTTTPEGMVRLVAADRIYSTGESLRYVRFLDDFPVGPLDNVWSDVGTGSFTDPKVYAVQTNTKVVERCILMTTDPGDLVLDPTCGSGTTAYVAEQWGRRWITIDTSRVALALARSRLMAAKYPYYLLADSEAGIRKEAEITGHARSLSIAKPTDDIRRGFVYERVPHVTLKSIAQNPDIREGMTREEIDAAIARHAETETLFDRPYEDRKIVRVSGPFTVESLSPHRVNVDGPEDLPAAESVPADRRRPLRRRASSTTSVAPASRTRKRERLEFLRLDPYPGVVRPGSRGVHRGRPGPDRGDRHRPGVRHRGSRAHPRRRQGGRPTSRTCSSCAASPSTRWPGRRPAPSAASPSSRRA